MKRAILISVLGAVLTGCNCGEPISIPCSSDSECGTGSQCVNGKCTGGGTGGGTGGTGGVGGTGGTGGTGGSGGGGGIVTGCNPAATDNGTRDTDCDGLTDLDEYNTPYAGNNKTDPCNSDSDGDGIRDGVELGRTSTVNAACGSSFVADVEPSTVSDPTNPDSDGDTIKDGDEDKNKDGRVDPGESNPARKDSDCDGLSDAEEVAGTLGCVTDPLKFDTDGDGLPDGVESGLVPPGSDPLVCKYTAIVFDTDPATKTGACNADTDGDGIQDGAEDGNHNGKVDPGELNPTVGTDGTGPAQQACATANLKPVLFHSSGLGDVQVALVPGFSEIGRLDVGGEKGLIFYDPTSKIAGLVFTKTPAGAGATAEESFGRGKFGPVTTPLTQTFTTWDGFASSVRGTYDSASSLDLKTRINDIAKSYLGATVTGLLQGTAGVTGPFKIQAEFVYRTATRAVVLIALVPAASYNGQNIFQLDDAAGGTALAQFGDYTATTCEVFLSDVNAKVDFLWVVDDSCSMYDSQQAVSRTGALVGQRLSTAGLDWRAAGVSSGYNSNFCSNGCTRAFTSDAALMTRWFTGGDSLFWGTSGTGTEQTLGSARKTIQSDLLPRNATGTSNKIRDGAQLHLLLVGDVDDQTSGGSGASFLTFFNNFDTLNSPVSKAVVHGIVCPAGTQCSFQEPTNPAAPRDAAVIAGTGGISADIRTFNVVNPSAAQQAAQTAVIDKILSAVINGTGHQLLKPPISATIKIAIEAGGTKGTCNVNDMPRDRVNGFDFDSASRRVVFFGNCIPNAAGKKVAVSYRYWLDASPDPNGDPCGGACTGGKVCEPATKLCICPTNCGGTCTAGTVCDMASCSCKPGIN